MAVRSDLEMWAERVAERAANWTHETSCGRYRRWEDLGVHGQAGLIGAVVTQAAIQQAMFTEPTPCPESN